MYKFKFAKDASWHCLLASTLLHRRYEYEWSRTVYFALLSATFSFLFFSFRLILAYFVDDFSRVWFLSEISPL